MLKFDNMESYNNIIMGVKSHHFRHVLFAIIQSRFCPHSGGGTHTKMCGSHLMVCLPQGVITAYFETSKTTPYPLVELSANLQTCKWQSSLGKCSFFMRKRNQKPRDRDNWGQKDGQLPPNLSTRKSYSQWYLL